MTIRGFTSPEPIVPPSSRVIAVSSVPRPAGEAALWAAVAAVWAVVAVRLTTAWGTDVELMHGWLVPVLCGWMMFERRRAAGEPAGGGRRARWVGGGLAVVGIAGLSFSVPLLEANRLWPTAQWLASGAAGVVSWGVLTAAGGPRWAGRFVFPLFFATTALTWPARVEAPLWQGLALANAGAAAEFVSLLGYPAVARGNVIEVGSGLVGVDEACAGLRSLQAVWMLAWFLGELGGLRPMRRGLLVLAGLVLAVAGNAARTVFLTLKVAQEGAAADARWHDLAGNVAMAGTLAGVVALGWWMGRREPARGEGPLESAGGGRLRVVWPVAVLAAALALELGTRGWFARRERSQPPQQWELRDDSGAWLPMEVAPRVHALLRYSSVDAFSAEREGWQAVAYVFRWEEVGTVGSVAAGHDPSICMPLIGAELEAQPADLVLRTEGRELRLRRYRFRGAGTTQQVFYGVWDAFFGREERDFRGDFLPAARLQRLWDGRNRADMAHVVFVLQGVSDDAEAAAWLERVAPGFLRAR